MEQCITGAHPTPGEDEQKTLCLKCEHCGSILTLEEAIHTLLNKRPSLRYGTLLAFYAYLFLLLSLAVAVCIHTGRLIMS